MTKRMLFAIYVGSAASIVFNSNLCFSQGTTITNVSFSVKDSSIVVVYDLLGPADQSYNVELALRRQSQPYFRVIPKHVEGDVGEGTRPGLDKQIVWHLYKDIPFGLDGNDYYFEVNAAPLNAKINVKSGSASWLYYVGSAVVVGAAAVFLGINLSNKSDGGNHLPGPPSRPQ